MEKSNKEFEFGCCDEGYHFVCSGVCTATASSAWRSKGFCQSIVERGYQSKWNYL